MPGTIAKRLRLKVKQDCGVRGRTGYEKPLGAASMKPDPSLDVTREPTSLSSEIEEVAIVGGVPATENKRRRLVRGAVALAPLVLTLRSGALAAASLHAAVVRNSRRIAAFMRADRPFRDGLCRPGALCIVFNLLSHGGKPEFLIRQRRAGTARWQSPLPRNSRIHPCV